MWREISPIIEAVWRSQLRVSRMPAFVMSPMSVCAWRTLRPSRSNAALDLSMLPTLIFGKSFETWRRSAASLSWLRIVAGSFDLIPRCWAR
jgi:hypothetical protein